jgi:DNA-binding transcriptional regulator/RsmH inhibitor MraZ
MKFYQMHENRVKMDKKGRVLIPNHIRKRLGKTFQIEKDKIFSIKSINLLSNGESDEEMPSNRN